MDSSATSPEVDQPPLANETQSDGSDITLEITGTITTTNLTNKISNRGLKVGSFQFSMIVAAGSCVVIVALAAIVVLVIYLASVRTKSFSFSLPINFSHQLSRQRQRSRDSNILSLVEVHPSADASILPNVDNSIRLEENSPLFPVQTSPSANAGDNESGIILSTDRSLHVPPRKCDRIPIYIFLGPDQRDPPFPKSPVECKPNLAYLHLGPDDNSTAAPLQQKPIKCKENAAYIHLDPEDTPT